uniref:(northern house mosquito) hypothetical protein n=1 Tax=Culex pipiens TaxID=7175 RepID=A0A8D8PGJ8_CULPI
MTLPLLDVHVEATLGPHDAVPLAPFPAKDVARAPVRVCRIKLGMQRRRSHLRMTVPGVLVRNLARLVIPAVHVVDPIDRVAPVDVDVGAVDLGPVELQRGVNAAVVAGVPAG